MRIDTTDAADPRVASYHAILVPKFAIAQNVFVIEGRQAVVRLIAARSHAIEPVLLTDTAYAAPATTLQHLPTHDVPAGTLAVPYARFDGWATISSIESSRSAPG